MNFKRVIKYTGFLGASVCGICLAKTCSKSYGSLTGTVSAESNDTNHETPVNPLAGLYLKQVHVYFRHGARTPINIIPGIEQVAYTKDMLRTPAHMNFKHEVLFLPDMTPRGDISHLDGIYSQTTLKGGAHAGTLTAYGQQQMYELGLELRRSYAYFLPTKYRPQDVFVQSTNVNRTIASARCVLAGLYGKENLNGTVVIPVSTHEDEVLFPNSHMCGVIRKVNHAAYKFADHIPGISKDRSIIESALGYTSGEICQFVFLRDDLSARQAHGYMIPEVLKPHMDMIEANAVKLMYYSMCGQHEAERQFVTRLSAGPALNLMMQWIDKFCDGEKTQKIFLYSTHDSTMVALLEAAGLFDWKWPAFAAELRVELYQDKRGVNWVRVLYEGKEQTLRGFRGPLIRYSVFKKRLSPYVIGMGPEYDQMCATNIKQLVSEAEDELENEAEAGEMSDFPTGM